MVFGDATTISSPRCGGYSANNFCSYRLHGFLPRVAGVTPYFAQIGVVNVDFLPRVAGVTLYTEVGWSNHLAFFPA